MSLQGLFSVAVVCLFACQLNQEWKEDKKVNGMKWGCKFVLFSMAVVCLLLISARLLCLQVTFFFSLSFLFVWQTNLSLIMCLTLHDNYIPPKQKQNIPRTKTIANIIVLSTQGMFSHSDVSSESHSSFWYGKSNAKQTCGQVWQAGCWYLAC